MLWTFLQIFRFIPHIASEEYFSEYFSQISFLFAMTASQIERFGQTEELNF